MYNVRLNVLLTHCFANPDLKAQRNQLEGLVRGVIGELAKEAQFPGFISVKFHSVPLNLQGAHEGQFSEGVRCFEEKLKKVQDRRPLSRRVFQPKQAQESTHFLFIAEGPAAWVVREVLARYNFWKNEQTACIVFLGSRSQAREGTMNYVHAIERYIKQGIFMEGGRLKRQNVSAQKAAARIDLPTTLAEDFAKIDELYAESTQYSDWDNPMSWHIDTLYDKDNTTFKLKNIGKIKEDLRSIIMGSVNLVEMETKMEREFEDKDVIERKLQERSQLSKSIADKMTDCTQPFDPQKLWGTPTAHEAQQENLTSPSVIVPKPESNKPLVPVSISIYKKKYAQHNLKTSYWLDECVEYFNSGHDSLFKGRFPQDAFANFSHCREIVKSASDAPRCLDLELDLKSAQSLICLGRYDHAILQLRDVLGRVEALQREVPSDPAEGGLILAITHETSFRLAACLMRNGQNTLAREHLKHVSWKNEDQRRVSLDQCVLKVNVHYIRELIEAHSGFFGRLQPCPDGQTSSDVLNHLKLFLKVNNVNPLGDYLFRSLELSEKVAMAKITMLQGNYKRARTDLQATLDKLRLNFGSENITTIEASLYYAQSMVHTCSPEEAMGICEHVRQIVETNLGARHPLWLEAYHIRVLVYRAHGSVAEALETICYLADVMSRNFSFDLTHPLALACVLQMGSLQIYEGNYSAAEHILKDTWEKVVLLGASNSEDHFSLTPACVEYLSELAWARCLLGNLDEAKRNISDCLYRQLEFYWPDLGLPDQWDWPSAKDYITHSLISALRGLIVDKLSAQAMRPNQQKLHPSLMYTLYVMSQIETRDEEPDWRLIDDINPLVLRGFELKLSRGKEDHEWTMRARLAMGHAQLAQGRVSHDEASQIYANKLAHAEFESVLSKFVPGSKAAGSHPLALHARRECLMSMMLAQADPSRSELQATRDQLRNTFSASRRYLGAKSPDTLLTQFYLLSLELILDGPDAANIREMLLTQLGSPQVLEQRLVETLTLLERVLLLYWGLEEYEIGREVVGQMRSHFIGSKIPNDDEIHKSAEMIVIRAESLLKDV